MDDLISRQAALKGLENLNIASFYELNEHSKEAYTEVKTMLKALPSAQPGCEDAVRVVRCGACKWWSPHGSNGGLCELWGYQGFAPEKNYCSAGERKERAAMDDLIRRKWLVECVDEGWIKFDTEEDTNRYIHLVRDIAPSAQPDVPDTNVGDINKFIDFLEEIFADIRERHVDDSVCGLCEYDGAYIGESGDWYNECPGFDRDDCFKLSDECRKKWIKQIIGRLPSAQPEQRWIPCSERLPEDDVEVLVTDDAGGVQWLEVDKMVSYEDGSGRFWLLSQHPSAWMPLPEPYREE